jgi:hypothetical protein
MLGSMQLQDATAVLATKLFYELDDALN